MPASLNSGAHAAAHRPIVRSRPIAALPHAHLPIALLRADGFTGTDTVDGRTEGVIHNIEGEHRVLQRLISKSIPQSEFPDETTFRAWATTNVSVVL